MSSLGTSDIMEEKGDKSQSDESKAQNEKTDVKSQVQNKNVGEGETKSAAKGHAKGEARNDAKSNAKGQAQIKDEEKSNQKGKTKTPSKSEVKGEAKFEAKCQNKAEANVLNQDEEKGESAKNEGKKHAKHEVKGQAKGQAKSEGKRQMKDEAKTEIKNESKIESKVESKGKLSNEVKGQTKSDVAARSESKNEARNDDTKEELKSEVKSEMKLTTRPKSDGLYIAMSSAGNLRFINDELRGHVTKLRNQLEAEKGNLKQAHRQKVLEIKTVREQEQKKTLATIIELKKKFHEEKIREVENAKENFMQKFEIERSKALKAKDTEMLKIKQELDTKEKMLNKLLAQSNASKNSSDTGKTKLLDELSELRSTKRQLEESLTQATVVEKHHSENLRKLCDSYEMELVRVRRDSHLEIRQLIEELKNKEKLIAQLEQDLGHQSSYMMQLEKKITTQDKGSSPLTSGSTTPGRTTLTAYNYSPSRDLDGNQQTNLKEHPDQQIKGSKSFSHLIRRADKENSSALAQIRSLQQKVSEQYKTIAALRQTCSEKDRRIELIQHRKMKRRLRRSLERTANDDDACSVDSEVSVSSLPLDNGSNEEQLDLWDEYAREEVERNYQQLMREHLELKKSYSMLQTQAPSSLDPKREAKLCRTLESDLFDAQCKIEELKALLHSTGLEPRLLEEKETLQAVNVEMQKKLQKMEECEEKLRTELNEAKELIEDLEFRVLELDECQNQSLEDGNDSFGNLTKHLNEGDDDDDGEKVKLTGGVSRTLFPEPGGKNSHVSNASHSSDMSSEDEQRLREEVNTLRKQIIELTERPVPELSLKTLTAEKKDEEGKEQQKREDDKWSDLDTQKQLRESQLRVEELEKTAAELQNKVIILQQEKLKLQERLNKLEKQGQKEKQVETQVQNLAQENKLAESLDSVNILDEDVRGSELSDDQIIEKNQRGRDGEVYVSQTSELKEESEKEVPQLNRSENESEIIFAESLDVSDAEKLVQSADSSVLENSLEEAEQETVSIDEEDSGTKESWKEIESAIICETIAELAAERDDESMDSTKMKEASLDLLNYPDNNSLLADDVDDENMELLQQQSECLESIKQILSEQGILSHVELMLKEMEEIKEENAMLQEKLSSNSYTLASGETINAEFAVERLHQLEELCENLRNKVHSTEQSEILLKTKLKHAEDTVSELEASESLLKEQLEKISVREAEWKKKAQGLLRSVSELEELLKEKDAIEEKLNEKILALEETELCNARKLAELREDENYLRESLRSRDDCSKNAEILQKIANLEKQNEQLRAKVSELEEGETLLREHWKQIADAEANKTECLQEKIKMLESLNKELQSKLIDEEERFETGVSLASELSFSENLADSEESRAMSEVESKLKETEARLYSVTESRNAKIEALEDRVERLQETEQKLSETIMEMEQREKQLLAKLKLCEHADFTVEKMLSYEDQIKELNISQENLLNAFDTLADPESQTQQIINALKVELLSCRQKSDDLCFKERQISEQLKNENNSLKNCLDQSEAKEKELTAKIQSLEEENKTRKGVPEESSSTIKQEASTSSLFVRIQELEVENQELRSKVDGSKNSSRPKNSSSISLNYERLCELEKENSELLAEVNKLRDVESQQKVTAEKIRLLEEHEENLMEKVMELEDTCESQKEELQKFQKDRSDGGKDLLAQLHASEAQLEEEQKRVAELQKLEAETQERLVAEEEANKALREQLQSFRLRLENVKDTFADHETSKKQLEQELAAVRHEKELVIAKLQQISECHAIRDEIIQESDSQKSSSEVQHSSESSNSNQLLPSTENRYLILIEKLELALKDISHSAHPDQWLTNESGEILFSPKKFLSESKINDSFLADPIFEELLQMSQKELAMLIQALRKEMQKKCEKLRDFQTEFMNFAKGIQHDSIIYQDEEVHKTVYAETRTFHKSSKNQVPTNEHTTPAGEKTTPMKSRNEEHMPAEPSEPALTQQQQQDEPKDKSMTDVKTTSDVKMPHAEYEAWQAKVAILTDIEANLPDVMESASQLELLLEILQERKNALCSDDKAGISNEELLYYAKLFQTLNKSVNGRPAHEGTHAAGPGEVLHKPEEQSAAKEEVFEPLPKAVQKHDTASASERKKLIAKLISKLSSEELAVAAKALKQSAAKRKSLKGGKFVIGLLGKLLKGKEEEEIDVDVWLSSEDDDDKGTSNVDGVKIDDGNMLNGDSKGQEAEQSDSDSSLLSKDDISKPEDSQNDGDKSTPPLPKTQPPSMLPELLKEPLDTFANTIDRNVAETQPNPASSTSQQAKSPDQSEQQVCELTRVLNDKNKYISTLEASIEKLGQLLAQQHGSTHTEEAIKNFEEQLKNLQQELRQHHKEGQQCLTSLRTELQNKSEVKHTTVVQNFQQNQMSKPAPLSHSYSTTDISKIVNASPDFDTPLKVPQPLRNWASRGHIAPPTFARTLRRRSDTFDPQLLPATSTGGGYMPPANLWTGEKVSPINCSNRMFVAAADYDPKLFSASGHPNLELQLTEGDVVKIKGPMGPNGYYEAEVKGKVGLVPAKYLHKLKTETMSSEEKRTFRLQYPGEILDSNPERMSQPEPWSFFQQSPSVSIPKVPSGHSLQHNLKSWNKSISMPRLPGPSTSSSTSTTFGGGPFTKRRSCGPLSYPPAKGLPEAPSNFCLERLVGENSVLLSWQPPLMDELDQNNGMQLIGYRIFINGRLCQQPGSAHLAKAVVENLDLSRPQYFAIQSVAASGQMSSPAEVVFEGLDRWLDDGASDIGSDTDLSDILPSPHLSLGPRKMYIAIYDYNPSTQSPHDYPDCELQFRAGDHITVYGNERSDGFYWGEFNGNRGLVPASFLEEVPTQGTRSKPVSRRGSTASQNSLLQVVGRPST